MTQNNDDIPEAVKPSIFLHTWQKERHDDMVRQMEDQYAAILARFAYFVGDLNAEQVRDLKTIFVDIHSTPVLLVEMTGMLTGCLVYSHGRTVEGKDPNEEMNKLLDASDNSTEESTREPHWQKFTETIVAEEAGKLKELNVQIFQGGPSVQCVNCGYIWASLQDRRDDRSGGCPGCIHKAKWG